MSHKTAIEDRSGYKNDVFYNKSWERLKIRFYKQRR